MLLRRLRRFVLDNNIARLLIFTGVVMIFGCVAMLIFEVDGWVGDDQGSMARVGNALWWTFVTMTTVGYGDLSPATPAGRVCGIIVMFFGVGFLGLFTGTVASIFVEKKMKEGRGLQKMNLESHIIICNWNRKVPEMISELLSERAAELKDVVVLASLEENPLADDAVYFVRGDPTSEESLVKAGIEEASAAIVVSPDAPAGASPDAQAVLTVLAIDSINPELYTCVELTDADNVRHCERAQANEIIVSGEMSARLLVGAALNPGISQLFSELVTRHRGNQIYKVPLPAALAGKTFLEALLAIRKEHQAILLAVQSGTAFHANPPDDHVLREGDEVLVMAERKPSL